MHVFRTCYWIELLLWLSTGVWLTTTAAQAHPHVWATIVTEVLFAPSGAVTGSLSSGDVSFSRRVWRS